MKLKKIFAFMLSILFVAALSAQTKKVATNKLIKTLEKNTKTGVTFVSDINLNGIEVLENQTLVIPSLKNETINFVAKIETEFLIERIKYNNSQFFKVEFVLQNENTKTYEDVLDAISNKKKKIKVPKIGDKFTVGNAECEVMSIQDNSQDLNACSIVIRMEYNGISYLFTGDAEKGNESARSWPQTDVLKAGHHGSRTSSSQKFLEQINPKLIIISCGKNNDYGHPHQETMNRYEKLNAKIYRTDESGDILITQTPKQ